MASVTIEIDLPSGVEITGYERHQDGHGWEHSRRVGDLGGFVSPLRSPIIVVSRHYLDKGNEHGEAPTWP